MNEYRQAFEEAKKLAIQAIGEKHPDDVVYLAADTICKAYDKMVENAPEEVRKLSKSNILVDATKAPMGELKAKETMGKLLAEMFTDIVAEECEDEHTEIYDDELDGEVATFYSSFGGQDGAFVARDEDKNIIFQAKLDRLEISGDKATAYLNVWNGLTHHSPMTEDEEKHIRELVIERVSDDLSFSLEDMLGLDEVIVRLKMKFSDEMVLPENIDKHSLLFSEDD